MPVVKTGNITYRALPIVIREDRSATVTVRTMVDGAHVQSRQIDLDPADLEPLLAAQSAPGKSRWDDLAEALYGLLIAKGEISGTVD